MESLEQRRHAPKGKSYKSCQGHKAVAEVWGMLFAGLGQALAEQGLTLADRGTSSGDLTYPLKRCQKVQADSLSCVTWNCPSRPCRIWSRPRPRRVVDIFWEFVQRSQNGVRGDTWMLFVIGCPSRPCGYDRDLGLPKCDVETSTLVLKLKFAQKRP